MNDSNQKSLALVFLSLGVIWLAGMASLIAIANFHGLQGLVALSFSGLFSTLIALHKSDKKTESEEIFELSRCLANGDSVFKILIPLFKFIMLVFSLYAVIYFAVARFLDGVQMTWGFVATLILVGIVKIVSGKENPLSIITSRAHDVGKKPSVGSFIVVGVLVTLCFMAALTSVSIETYPAPIRLLIVLVWLGCYYKLMTWIAGKCGAETTGTEISKIDIQDSDD
ncbi:MAG: hypothetical protein SGJ27_00020 [Candidatus Melainabacteria bacterium]|nr:hypothetical protein [Candidatus Melainabacteria bacterium]